MLFTTGVESNVRLLESTAFSYEIPLVIDQIKCASDFPLIDPK